MKLGTYAALLLLIWGNMLHGQSKVYWIDSYLDQIKRANLDGSDVETVIFLGNSVPQGIDIDNEHGKMYWVDSYQEVIQRANSMDQILKQLSAWET